MKAAEIAAFQAYKWMAALSGEGLLLQAVK
ncbi:hypothetical protein SAMN05444743_111101 [Pseudomonas sp. PDC86]|nr:hypothetical protein SAMN05444743_111101 [Pseudomonas sp. PDC86]